eukprot:2757752-Rhodomonas_salina.2
MPETNVVVPAGGTYFCDWGFPWGWCCGADALATPSACDPELLAKEAFNHLSILVEKVAGVLIRAVVSAVRSRRARVACTLEAALAW